AGRGRDDGALAERTAAEQVGCAAAIVVVVRSEDHCSIPGSSPAVTGRPAARHSGKPSFNRRARRPFASTNWTARSASTQYGPRQYATYSLPLGSSLSRRFNSSTGREIAPGMWPAAYSLAGLASRITMSFERARFSSSPIGHAPPWGRAGGGC